MVIAESPGGSGGWPPNETDAAVGTLVNASEELTQLSSRVGVSGQDLLGSVSTGAMSFSDAISPAISAKGHEAVSACQNVVGEALVGASVAAAFSEDISDYNSKITTLQNRWAPWAGGGVGTASALRLSEEEIDAQREAIRGQIQKEANDAYSELEDAADDRGAQLSAGATKDNVRDLIGEGTLSWWAAYELFGFGVAGNPPDFVVEEAAERVAELLNSHGIVAGEFDMSHVDHANRIMEIMGLSTQRDLFATKLMEEMGPSQLGDHPDAIARYAATLDDPDAIATVETLYANLGVALATATDKSSEHHVSDEWVQEFMDYGASNESGTYGYQKLAPLFRHGVYSEDFIVPVAHHVVGLDRDGADWGLVAGDGHPMYEGTPYAYNPVNSALFALDRNPDAALAFFTHRPDSWGFEYTDLQLEPPDPLEYLLNNSENPTEGIVDTNISADLTGDAIIAAVTGVTSNAAESGTEIDPPTAMQATLLARTVDIVGEDPSRWMPNGAATDMVEDFATVTNYYMDDFYNHFLNDVYAEDGDGAAFRDKMPDLFGAEVDFFNNKGPNQWFQILGSQKETALEVSAGLDRYGSYALSTVLENGGSTAEAGQAVYPIGGITAQLANGQIEAHDAEKIQEQDRNNFAIDQGKKVVDKGLGLTPWGKTPVGSKANSFATKLLTDAVKMDVTTELFENEGETNNEIEEQLITEEWWKEILEEHRPEAEYGEYNVEIKSELSDGFRVGINEKTDEHGNSSGDEAEDRENSVDEED